MGAIKQQLIIDYWDLAAIRIDYVHIHEGHELLLEVEGFIDPPEKGDLESQDFPARAWLIEVRLDGKKWKGELTEEETNSMKEALLEAWEATL